MIVKFYLNNICILFLFEKSLYIHELNIVRKQLLLEMLIIHNPIISIIFH